MDIFFRFPNPEIVPDFIHVWFTSEANSYGLAGGHWFDGEVEYSGTIAPTSQFASVHHKTFEIYAIIEYKTLASQCSQDSYYECLAKRFSSFPLDNIDLNGSCLTKENCVPYLMPRQDSNIKVCNKEYDRTCHIMFDLMKTNI